jgi:hypothetical protein
MKSMGATVPLLFKTPRKPLETRKSVALFHVRSHHARPPAGKQQRGPGRGFDTGKPSPLSIYAAAPLVLYSHLASCSGRR